MAGYKINTKKKDEKSKVNRISSQATDENEETDFSLLRKPILTNITGFAQARKIFDQATEELQNLLTNECDLLYECKVCRNIFRSLANFISHKRVYCKEKFNTSIHGHFFKETSTIQEVLKIRKLEESYQESLKEINDLNCIDDEDTDKRIPITKDITEVVEKIIKHKGVQAEKIKEQQLAFQKIPKSSVAVYQNLIEDDTSNDCMQVQVKELNNILSQDNAVLQSDGTFKVQSNNNESSNTDNVIQISDDEDIEDKDVLKCRICDLQFSTQKTLKFHMKYKHVESRLVYPCPDCLDIFSTSWSVYRHLFKVHRKTAAQIRRLRESIQAKAFRMNNPPAFYEKRKTIPKNVVPQKITEEERLEQENQAWLEQLDGEGDGRRCGGCGRNFERRAALAAHAHTCARRHRRRIQIQIRRDYHKAQHNPYLPSSAQPAPLGPLAPSADTTPAEDSATVVEDSATVVEDSATVVEGSTTVVEDSATVVEDSATVVENSQKEEKILGKIDKKVKDEDEGKELTDAMTLIDEKKEPDIEDKEIEDDDKIEDDIIVQNKLYFFDSTLRNKLPFAQQAEKSNLNAFKQKMQSDTDIDQMLCKKCDTKFNEFNELFNHMGAHYKWVRYACKLCNFKHFDFEKLPEHVKIVHKLKGDTDFYYSTVKAVDGAEALELAETSDEVNDTNEISPDSRRPSRCSSDSSRLSDDSSSSSNRVEAGSRKRKASRYKNNLKKKKDAIVADDGDDLREDDIQKDVLFIENDSSSNSKIFEENSSDLDEVDEKITRRHHFELSTTVASRRPVRNKTKRKNEDFEYDLSNLLKMEAQGYRDSQTISTKSIQNKKRMQQDIQNNYELINKDCSGALITLSRKSVENAQGHMKTLAIFNISKESRISTVFARPMTPKVTKVDKISPKKDEKESKDTCSPNKVIETSNLPANLNKDLTNNKVASTDSVHKEFSNAPELEISKDTPDKLVKVLQTDEKTIVNSNKEEVKELSLDTVKRMAAPSIETSKTNINMPVVPIKFRQRSLEVIKNPLIKKNITDFTKAGMKTKILVIKPINRNADGTQSINSSLKFQTIKLKDPNNSSLNEDKKDQVVVVQVPKVDCTVGRSKSSNSVVSTAINASSIDDTKNPVNEDENVPMDTTSSENDPIVLDDCSEDQVSSKKIKSVLTSDSSESVIKTSETVINLDNPTNIEG